ncbi:MAG: AAA family ATPase, partial [Anaerolineae bacterium]
MQSPSESARDDRQPQPLLTTKLYVPSPRPNWIPRPRLLQRLDQGLSAAGTFSPTRLTLVSAPAGYGKTTLLAEWVAQAGQPVAWLSLEESENDPARFLAYLAAALEKLPGCPPLPAPADRAIPGEATLTMLVNRISERHSPTVLILDDFHRVTAPQVHEVVEYLLDHAPPTLRLVIATRADPPLPIARLRAGGQLTEIRQADLRFSHAEAAAFLRSAVGHALTDEQVAMLAGRTEGWIAGLQMAAASMEQREDLGDFVHTFAGSHRYVMDYLLEEVLRRQRPEVQTFLLQTAILERLSASLCDAVLLQPPPASSQSILEHLDQANLFITPLDDRRIWYRYHRLFADLLRRRLLER